MIDLEKPLISAVLRGMIWGLASAVVVYVMSLFILTPQGIVLSGFQLPLIDFFLIPVQVIARMFILSLFIWGISSLSGGERDFDQALQAGSYIFVLIPFQSLAAYLPSYSTWATSLITLWSFWILYNLLIIKLKARKGSARALLIVILALFLISRFSSRIFPERSGIPPQEPEIHQTGLTNV